MVLCNPKVASGRKSFRYFRMWKSHANFFQQVRECLRRKVNGSLMFQVLSKLKMLKKIFKELNRSDFSNIQEANDKSFRLMDLSEENLKKDPLNKELILEEKRSREEYGRVRKAFISFLQQKAKINWGREGDMNSALYHVSIRNRRRQNRILSVVKEDGTREHDPEEITNIFLQYYMSHLGECLRDRIGIKKSAIQQGKILNDEQRRSLELIFTDKEIQEAVFEIPGIKAPGPDGYGAYFFSGYMGNSGRLSNSSDSIYYARWENTEGNK